MVFQMFNSTKKDGQPPFYLLNIKFLTIQAAAITPTTPPSGYKMPISVEKPIKLNAAAIEHVTNETSHLLPLNFLNFNAA